MQIGTVRDPELRVQIVSERSTFDEDPAAFHKKYAEKQVRLRPVLCCDVMCCAHWTYIARRPRLRRGSCYSYVLLVGPLLVLDMAAVLHSKV